MNDDDGSFVVKTGKHVIPSHLPEQPAGISQIQCQ